MAGVVVVAIGRVVFPVPVGNGPVVVDAGESVGYIHKR